MKLSVFLFFLCGSLLTSFADEARAQLSLYDEAGRTYKTRFWSFDAQTTYYQSTANYTKGGAEYVSLAEGHKYNLIDFDFGTRYVPSADWAIYMTSQVSNAESSDGVDVRRNSTFSKAVLGTDFLIFSSKRFDFYPDVSLTFPIERIDTASDEVLNREGAVELSSRLIGRLHWKSLDPYAFTGFTYRDQGRSSLLPYGLGIEFRRPKWSLGGEVRGYQTVIKDKFSDTPLERESVAPRNGGALRYFSINPSLMEANAWVRGNITKNWNLKVGGGTSITGTNTSAGWNLIASLSYTFRSGALSRHGFWRKKTNEDTDRFIEEINDGVDQSLFTPPPVPPRDEKEVRKKKIQKELDQTEFQIELKRTKPRKK